MGLTDTNALSPGMRVYYSMELMARLKPFLVHGQFGKKGRIPKGQGSVMRVLQLNALAANKTPLTEGSPPAGKTLAASYIDLPVKQFGDFVNLTDVAESQVFSPLIGDIINVLGQQAGLSIDGYSSDQLNIGTNVQYSNGSSRVQVGAAHKFTADEAMKAVRTHSINSVLPFDDGLYRALVHPKTVFDLRKDSRWLDANKYVDPSKMESGEVGVLDKVRYIQSPACKIFTGAGASGIDVYSTLIFGKDWYATPSYENDVLGQSGAMEDGYYELPVDVILKALGSSGTADPLNQQSTMGWKVSYNAVILNELCGIRCEHSAS